jgi:hypothetical protein
MNSDGAGAAMAAAPDAGAVAGQSADSGAADDDPTADAGVSLDAGVHVAPAPKDVSQWDQAGPFSSVTEFNSGPDGAYTIYRPAELGKNGVKHPIITWGNGTYTTPATYDGLLAHWATHGFVVVASNSTNTGSGEEMIAGFDWLIAENSRSGSVYFGKLDTTAIASVGHSQGGIGTILAAVDPRVITAVPIAGGDPKVEQVHGPLFLIGFSNDTVVPPPLTMAPQYEAADVPSVFGVVQGGATHLEPLGDGGKVRGYTTAWFALQLMKDSSASGVFYGKDCTLCTDKTWVVERKKVPGVVPPVPPTPDECLANAYFPSGATDECKQCLCSSCPLEATECSDACWNMAKCMITQCTDNTTKDIANNACVGITGDGVCGSYGDGFRWTTALSEHGAGCMAPGKCLEICVP